MKNCMDCGTPAPDEAPACEQCGRKYAFVSGASSSDFTADDVSELRERPDGGRLLTLGWILLALGVVMFVVAISSTGRSTYYGPDLDAMARQWTFTMISAGLFGLSLVLLLAGIIVRAIWFLPGPDYKARSGTPYSRSENVSAPSLPATQGRPGYAGDDGAIV
jgi:hypothetical protein